jgi:hypothetical protein
MFFYYSKGYLLMVNNTPAQREKMTQYYERIYSVHREKLARLNAETAYYNALLKDKYTSNDEGAKIGLKAVGIQRNQTQKALNSWLADSERARSRGEINKYW